MLSSRPSGPIRKLPMRELVTSAENPEASSGSPATQFSDLVADRRPVPNCHRSSVHRLNRDRRGSKANTLPRWKPRMKTCETPATGR